MAPTDSGPRVIESVDEMQAAARSWRADGQRIAFVPTMGFLHDGHAALLDEGRKHGDVLVLSIFVNPTQFGQGEDYGTYPRDLDHDLQIAREHGVDVAFSPTRQQMYPDAFQTWVEVTGVTENLCGADRPGHFRGVTTVVTKLFNIVMPHVAVFGEKDFQQLVTIRRMVADLNLDIEIIAHPIVRESDGLAMSSRNEYLSPTQREQALTLSSALAAVRERFAEGERNADRLLEAARGVIARAPDAAIDYVSLVDAETIQPLETVESRALLALAVRFGKTRLIDNTVLE